MNAKEAKEIITRERRSRLTGDYISYGDFFEAKGYLAALRGEEIEALVAAVESAHKRLREKAQSAKRVWSTQQWLKKDQEQYDLEEKALKAFRAARGEKE